MVWKALRPIRTDHSAWEISAIRNAEAAAAAAAAQEAAPAAANSSGVKYTTDGTASVANGHHQGFDDTGGQPVESPLKNGTALKGINGRVPANGSVKFQTARSEEIAQHFEAEKQSHMQTPRNGQKLVADARG